MNYRYIVSGIAQNGTKIILGEKAKGAPPYPDVWHTPGGGVENAEKAKLLFEAGDFNNEYLHTELQREIQEELGVEIKNIRNIVPEFRPQPRQGEALNKDGEPTHYYFLEYLCDYAGGELIAGDDLAEVKWVDKTELHKVPLTPPSLEMYKELGWI